jgi:hypothetical protein
MRPAPSAGFCVSRLYALLGWRIRKSRAARLPFLAGVADLSDIWIDRIAALALLHDFGKANAGFQARTRPSSPIVGHIDEAATALARPHLAAALGLDRMDDWSSGAVPEEALRAIASAGSLGSRGIPRPSSARSSLRIRKPSRRCWRGALVGTYPLASACCSSGPLRRDAPA